MIEAILPAAARSAESPGNGEPPPLFAAEEELIARAVAKRRREFADGRDCARRALGAFGIAPVAILRGERGEPLWPAGMVGAITHCDGYRGSAVAREHEVAALGIDAEPHAPLPDGVLAAIARPEEVERVVVLAAAEPGIHWDRLLFCAKESIYKAWYPLARRPLGFEDASVRFDVTNREFTARLLVPAPTIAGKPFQPSGRWLVADGFALAATAVIP